MDNTSSMGLTGEWNVCMHAILGSGSVKYVPARGCKCVSSVFQARGMGH